MVRIGDYVSPLFFCFRNEFLHSLTRIAMKRITKFTITGLVLSMAIAATQTVRAGGISLYEIATPDVGLASAGYASRADDASTLFKNPAGMSRLDTTQLQTGLQALYGSVSFTPGNGTSPGLGTDEGGNGVGWLPGASLFVVAPIGEKFRVGFGNELSNHRLAIHRCRTQRHVRLPRYADGRE